jgi:hypothetical protein
MNRTAALAIALALSAVTLHADAAKAQRPRLAGAGEAPCALSGAVIDSARVDASSVLFSDSPLVAELRREQNIPASANQVPVSVVRDGLICQRLSTQFDHRHSATSKFAVLRVGPIYYVRDPDQSHATGMFADSTFHVLMRLGAALDK